MLEADRARGGELDRNGVDDRDSGTYDDRSRGLTICTRGPNPAAS